MSDGSWYEKCDVCGCVIGAEWPEVRAALMESHRRRKHPDLERLGASQ